MSIYEVTSNVDLTKLGARPKGVGHLDPEIAAEGFKVSEGDKVSYSVPAHTAPIFDYSQIKYTKAGDGRVIEFQKYFWKRGYEPWPAWLYHPTEKPVECKDQAEGAQYGVFFRETTPDEKMQLGGKSAIWDWRKDTLWRPMPHEAPKHGDPHAAGKELIVKAPDPMLAQTAMLAKLAEAIGKNSSANSTQLIEALTAVFAKMGGTLPEAPKDLEVEPGINISSVTGERELWTAEAERKGIKVDGRWSFERLKAEVERHG